MNVVGSIHDEKTGLFLPVVIARGNGFLSRNSGLVLGDTSFFTGVDEEVRPYLSSFCTPVQMHTDRDCLVALKFRKNTKSAIRCRRCMKHEGKYFADIILIAEGTTFTGQMARVSHDYA